MVLREFIEWGAVINFLQNKYINCNKNCIQTIMNFVNFYWLNWCVETEDFLCFKNIQECFTLYAAKMLIIGATFLLGDRK